MIDFWSEQNNLSTERSADSTLIKSFHRPISLQCRVNNNSIPQLLFSCDLICFCLVRSCLVVIPIQILGSLREGKYGICVNNPWLRVQRSFASIPSNPLCGHILNHICTSKFQSRFTLLVENPTFFCTTYSISSALRKKLQGAPVAFVRLHT